MLQKLRTRIALITISAFSTPGLSAEEVVPGEELFFDDLPVVLTVTRLPQSPTELPASVTLIDRSMIEASGVIDIPDLLRLVAGFQVGHVGSSRTTVTYHGMADDYARRMQVLVDGRSVYLPATGSVDWVDLPLTLEEIERIEVTRGPNSVTYGANAFLGVINIITTHPVSDQGFNAKHVQGNGGVRQTTVRYGGANGDYQYRLTAQERIDHGFPDWFRTGGTTFYDFHDDKLIHKVNYRGEYRADVNDYLSIQGGVNHGILGGGFRDDKVNPAHNEDHLRYFGQFKWRRIFSSTSELELQYYHIHSHTDATYQVALLSDIFGTDAATIQATFGYPDQRLTIEHDLDVRRDNIELQHRFSPFDGLRLVWGFESRREQVTAPGFMYSHPHVETALNRAFVQGEWRANEHWLVNAGVMQERSDLGGSKTSPRLAVNYLFDDENALRLSYTRAYRAPAVYEEYADYAGRFPDGVVLDQLWYSYGNIEAEEISAYELGWVGQAADGRFHYDAKLFRTSLSNLIASPLDRNFAEPYSGLCVFGTAYKRFCTSTVFLNSGNATAHGFEAQARYQFNRQAFLSLGYSRTKAEDTYTYELNPDVRLSSDVTTPVNTVSLLAQMPFGPWMTGSVGIYHVDNMRFFGGDETDGVTTADLRFARRVNVGGAKGEIELIWRDALGTYFDYVDYSLVESMLYMGATIEI